MIARPRTHFLCCIPLEGAVTALGYFDASLSLAGILFFLRMLIYGLIDYLPNYSYHYPRYVFFLTYFGSTCAWLLGLALCLLFAIYLIVGVNKRRPGYVLSYLISSILKAIALTAYWAVLYADRYYYFIWLGLSLFEIIIALLVHLLCVVMVYFVYRNIKMEKGPHNMMIYNVLLENSTNDIKKDVV